MATTISSNYWTETFTLAGIRERERRAHHAPNAAAVQQQEPNDTMATTMSSNYWTATAHHVMPTAVLQQQSKYVYDDCGIKHRINTEDETTCIICEPWCTSCGYPPHICDEYYTRCTGTKLGRWFDEQQGSWIEEEEEEEEGSNQHKFGLCPICKIGLDDKSEFTFNYAPSTYGALMCWDCDDKHSK